MGTCAGLCLNPDSKPGKQQEPSQRTDQMSNDDSWKKCKNPICKESQQYTAGMATFRYSKALQTETTKLANTNIIPW